jgi:Transposase domain (DUF772)
LLFPPSPRDWLPEGHLAFFIADTVAALDLRAFYAPYDADGRRNQPFDPHMMVIDPHMMVTVLLYAYATGTFSSRRIARKLEEDVAYRVLAPGNFPAHRTIADFRSPRPAPWTKGHRGAGTRLGERGSRLPSVQYAWRGQGTRRMECRVPRHELETVTPNSNGLTERQRLDSPPFLRVLSGGELLHRYENRLPVGLL